MDRIMTNKSTRFDQREIVCSRRPRSLRPSLVLTNLLLAFAGRTALHVENYWIHTFYTKSINNKIFSANIRRNQMYTRVLTYVLWNKWTNKIISSVNREETNERNYFNINFEKMLAIRTTVSFFFFFFRI